MSKPLILVTNDDGINAPGLRLLARALGTLGEVVVVAPADERSAVSHSLTIHHPVRIWPLGKRRFAVTGTPVDCVLFGLQKLTPKKPDLLVSGINAGANVGDDTLYSGTVAAAREASLYQVPSIAVSHAILNRKPDYARAAEFTRDLAAKVLNDGLPPGVFLNLNFPVGEPAGVKITRQGTKEIQDSLISEKDDPRGKKYYWIGQDVNNFAGEPDTDYFAMQNGFISISPLQRDATAYRALEAIQSLSLGNGDRRKRR